ncbi:hypothetical protein RhiirA4_530048 [Rhizophagus irregularis]|uniref:Uncharacterized protein n=1 Tax=Rhizophagus irregularis TaxID=588596 RepID=A0A2I1G064_9GLOM|nr:hypothetical protein RhiirA4_530048 [Rhizophagus irregularis]
MCFKIEISPNEKYLITYSIPDDSIVGWNVEDKDKVQLKFDQTVEVVEDNEDNDYSKNNEYEIKSLCVSDDKKLAYIRRYCYVIDMNNKDKIELSFDSHRSKYCTFNLKGELILYSLVDSYFGEHKIIWIYSTQTKNNKWEYKNKKIKYCWNSKYKRFNGALLVYQTRRVFGIQNGRVWKSKFYENMSNKKIVECDEYLNVHSFNLYNMDTVSTLFQKAIDGDKKSTELAGNLIKWDIRIDYCKIKLEVFKKINTKWESICTRIENYHYPCSDIYNGHKLIASSLFNNDDIIILTTFGFNEQ